MLDENLLKQVMASILEINLSEINEQSSMDTIDNWDSLHHMKLVLALEDEFKVSIPDEDAANITSYSLIKIVLDELLNSR